MFELEWTSPVTPQADGRTVSCGLSHRDPERAQSPLAVVSSVSSALDGVPIGAVVLVGIESQLTRAESHVPSGRW